MKKILILSLLICMIISCNNPADKATVKIDSADAKPIYAYTIDKPDNWVMGGAKNTSLALASLKAFETNKIDECISYFADSVDWKADYFEAKLSKDSLRSIFNESWKEMASLKINMHDFESVVSKDKHDEYVTLWYKQTTTDKKGKIDSVEMINDMKMLNGKIIALDESMRHFKKKN